MGNKLMNYQSQTIYARGSKGEIRQWSIRTEGSEVISSSGTVDGAPPRETSYVAKPMNVGRGNETTAEEQAVLEAKSKERLKLRKKYFLTMEEAEEGSKESPMLAHKFKDKQKYVVYPAFVQPKLDGNRCLAMWKDDEVILMSRGNKILHVPQHINEAVSKFLPKDAILDGELYIHGLVLPDINKRIKKARPETLELVYHTYDLALWEGKQERDFTARGDVLSRLIKGNPCPEVKLVDTRLVLDRKDVDAWEVKYIDQGYEGAMFRNAEGMYRYDYRSADLLKIKRFMDEEFTVVDILEAKDGTAIAKLDNPKGAQFKAKLSGSHEFQRSVVQNKEEYIGRQLTVTFQQWSPDGIPTGNTVGKCFREEADLPKK